MNHPETTQSRALLGYRRRVTRAAPASERGRQGDWRAPSGARSLVGEIQHTHRFTLIVLAVTLLVSLLSSGFLLLYTQPRLSGYVEMTRHARDAHEAMLDQETGLRGWLATGDRVFLEPFVAGRANARRSLEALLGSTREDPDVSDAVRAMLLTRQSWNSWAARAAAMRVTPTERDSGELTSFLLQGKQLFDAYRQAEGRSTALIRARRTSALRLQSLSLVLLLAVSLAVLGGTGYVAVRRRRQLTATVVEPIDGLLGTIDAFGAGDLAARHGRTGVRELDEIGSALDDLAGQLELARAEAKVREERLSYLASRFETVVSVGTQIAGSLSVHHVADTVTTAAAELLDAPTVLWGRGAGGGLVVTRRSCDSLDAPAPENLVVPEVVLVTAADARAGTDGIGRAYPLVLAGTVMGVLQAATTRVDTETEQVLEALLATAAAALESAHLHSTTRELADLDALTRLPNRRRFESDIDAEWERCRRYGSPLSVVMLDLDHFKRLNDGHGHLMGDDVLRAAAQAIGSALRVTDTAYRYGGEEFVVLLRETARGDATAVAERIRVAVSEVRVPGSPGVRVTCSAGVAQRLATMAHHTEMVAVADAALYDAKHAGRNRVTAGPSVPEPAL